MLKPEVAKQKIAECLAPDPERFLPKIEKLPTHLQNIAKCLCNRNEEAQEYEYRHHQQKAEQVQRCAAALDACSPSDFDLLISTFFTHLKEPIKVTWQMLPRATYQTGYARKAFRAPHLLEASRTKRFAWLSDMVMLSARFKAEILTARWLAAWAPYTDESYNRKEVEIGRLLAGVIDARLEDADEIFNILCESVRNEHEIGMMGRHVMTALLSSSRSEGWELMEKTLLAAQRQEGLRQQILETIDESHPEAFKRMLKLILDNNLVRFSAVTRALDVWLAFFWDSISTKVVNDTIKSLLHYLEEPQDREKALEGKSPEEAYLALWAMAYEDAEKAATRARKLLSHTKAEFRYIAANLLRLLGISAVVPALFQAIDDKELPVAWLAFRGLMASDASDNDEGEGEQYRGIPYFVTMERLFHRLPLKPTKLKALVWPWLPDKPDRGTVAAEMLESVVSDAPERIIPYVKALDSWKHSRAIEVLAKQENWSKETRAALIDAAGDSSSVVREASYTALANQPLQVHEVQTLEKFLTRKTSDQRRGILKMLLAQEDNAALASAERLTASKDALQRLAGLELFRHLAEANRERDQCLERATTYQTSRKKLTDLESTQIKAILESGQVKLSLNNALGLMNPDERTPVIKPTQRAHQFFTPAAIACLKSLDDLIHEHRDKPFKPNYGEEQLLGSAEYGFPYYEGEKSRESNLARLPYSEVWIEWMNSRPMAQRDTDGMELFRAELWASNINESCVEGNLGKILKNKSKQPELAKIVHSILCDLSPIKLKYGNLIPRLLFWLNNLYPAPNKSVYILNSVESVLAMIPDSLHASFIKEPDEDVNEQRPTYYYSLDDEESDDDWRSIEPVTMWIELLHSNADEMTEEQQLRGWQLLHWYDQPVPGASRRRPPVIFLKTALMSGQATPADWYDDLLGVRGEGTSRYSRDDFDSLHQLTALQVGKQYQVLWQKRPDLADSIDKIRQRLIEIELARGDAATPATRLALKLSAVYGIDLLLKLLLSLGKTGFKLRSSWRDPGVGRADTLTHLVSICHPFSHETASDFTKKAKAAIAAGELTQDRLLQLAFLAPQWAKFIEAYLNWPGLVEGLCWYLAHMSYVRGKTESAAEAAGFTEVEESVADSESENNKKTTSGWNRYIRERTPLTNEERQEGAVDVGWFQKTYAILKDDRWHALAIAARFAANPAQAKKAQFVGDVLLGKVSRKELINGVAKKKLKDYVRLLGLLPLATGQKREPDLAERYKVLQEYLRYARGLSAMSKEGAVRAAEIGIANLARTAGYPDPLRMQWTMEAHTVKDLAKGSVSVNKGDVKVTLALDVRALPVLTVHRQGKELKAIPPAVKKDKKIAEIAGRVSELKKQSSRIKQSLETAMIRGDTFLGSELPQLADHAVLAPELVRLVLIGEDIMGYPDKKGKVLRNHKGKLEPIKKSEVLRIAHPHDLYQSKEWESWQRECFASERMQPFKQVFRELYLLTKQERADSPRSLRYSGQQIQERQASALWGSRGWSTRDGVSKTFFDVGITAEIGFNSGITTPLEVEGLTINHLTFRKRDEYKPLALKDVPARIFSEVMRDMDLVVSVAHRGGVDPEASASTVEMRAALLKETCQLLQLKNVKQKANHVIIKGHWAEYTIHLGSGTVHKMPGGALCIVPVHAQHRGRLFLPFADDDPKTAEVISKTLMLARDHEIQDSSILDQLR